MVLKVFGLFHNLMAFGAKKQLNVSVTAYLQEKMKMMKSYNYCFIPTSVFSEPYGKSTTNQLQMSAFSYNIGITGIWDMASAFR